MDIGGIFAVWVAALATSVRLAAIPYGLGYPSTIHTRPNGRFSMTRVLYRIAAVLILLFCLGHSAGYPWSDPAWGIDLGGMQSSRFDIFGFSRT